MQMTTAKALELAAEIVDVDCRIMEGYSGRGMCGRTTTAISLAGEDYLCLLIAHASRQCSNADFQKLVDDCHNIRKDDLGKGIVVY